MKRSLATAKPDTDDLCVHFPRLLETATGFLPSARAEALMRSWLVHIEHGTLPEQRFLAHVADALLLTRDLLLSQPSSSGATAFDRLAKSLKFAPPAVPAALAALSGASFRLLRLNNTENMARIPARDMVSGDTMHIVGMGVSALPLGMYLFARTVMLSEDTCFLAGAITPLDDAAFAVAIGHNLAGAAKRLANCRWAEIVYGHVVRHGTLDIVGLNRPADFFDWDEPDAIPEEGPLMDLAGDWLALEGAAPPEELLERTRTLTEPMAMVDAMAVIDLARHSREAADLAEVLERILLVQMETAQRREQAGCGHFTLDDMPDILEEVITAGMPASIREIFVSLRQRLPKFSLGRPDEPAMERLLGRIKGLRAKTVAQGCTEQEALAAAAKVAELLDRYGLSLGELDFAAQPCEGTGVQTTRKRFAPLDNCVPVIAAFFDCRVWIEQNQGETIRYVFFGLRGDVNAAEYLYEMVERAFETETATFRAGEIYLAMAGERRSASNSFQAGLARGINDKLRALRKSRDAHLHSASGRDLVPIKAAMVDDELAKLGLQLRARGVGGTRRVLTDAFEAGHEAGQRFEFRTPIASAA